LQSAASTSSSLSTSAVGDLMTASGMKPTPGVQPFAAPAAPSAITGSSSMNVKAIDDKVPPVAPPSSLSSSQPPLPGTTAATTKKSSQQRYESFPEKLYRMLVEVEAKGRDDIISFTLEGDRFEIHQPEVFEEEVRIISFTAVALEY
jgi:hypothetical protein